MQVAARARLASRAWTPDVNSWIIAVAVMLGTLFYINIPIGVAAFLMTSWFVSDPPYVKRGTSRVDYWGDRSARYRHCSPADRSRQRPFSLWTFSRLSLAAGYWDIFFPQLIQVVGIGLIFVPLTTVAHAPVAPEKMGNATSIFNAVRNIDGSLGITAMTTLVDRNAQEYISRLGEHITWFDPVAQANLNAVRTGLMSRGVDFYNATQQAYAVIYGQIQRQATMLSFVAAFWALGIISVALMPLVFLMQKPKQQARTLSAH